MDEVEVIAKGPLFDGRVDAHLAVFMTEAIALVAAAAKEQVDANLEASIRHPGSPPYYQEQINVAQRGLASVVNDGQVIYGPWLEGVGSRNAPVTIFPGYFSFRRARQVIDRTVPTLVMPALARFGAAMLQ